jgi:hypothetical protein
MVRVRTRGREGEREGEREIEGEGEREGGRVVRIEGRGRSASYMPRPHVAAGWRMLLTCGLTRLPRGVVGIHERPMAAVHGVLVKHDWPRFVRSLERLPCRRDGQATADPRLLTLIRLNGQATGAEAASGNSSRQPSPIRARSTTQTCHETKSWTATYLSAAVS